MSVLRSVSIFHKRERMTFPIILAISFFGHFIIVLPALALNAEDTVSRKTRPLIIRTTSRLHSATFFYLGGKIAGENPGMDVSINLETPRFGYSFLKAADLADLQSSFNFALAALYLHLNTGKFRFTPQAIVLIEQPGKLVDKGSDMGVTFTSLYRISDVFAVEETAICFNLFFETSHLDFINRLRLLYSKRHVDLTAMFWHNNDVLDHDTHVTSAISVAYARVKISKTALISAMVTASATLASSGEERVPKENALMITISVTTLNN